MAKLVICSFLFVLSLVSATNPPKWDPVYSVKGILYIPYAEIEEPFFGWYDSVNKRSRIDYYGGMVKTYQLPTRHEYGANLKVAPVTTEDELNKVTCLEVNGTSEEPTEIQSILPNAKGFILAGTEELYGLTCDKFVFEETIGMKVNRYALWVRYKKSPKYPSSRMPIPVRYEMRGYNTLLGSHYDHYYLNYEDYSHNDIPEEIFEVPTKEPCIGFPGPGTGHYTTFNPIKEFIHPRSTQHVDDEFHRFTRKHGKRYNNDNEHEMRKSVFSHNLRFIHSQNRARLGYSLGVNHLADRTSDELKALRGFRATKLPEGNGGRPFPYNLKRDKEEVPESLDWRLFGAVTPVKDQSVCGSCWSFGTVGAIEGAYFLKNGGNLVRLSQQALIDCSWGFGNNGCDGGEDFRVYQWMKKHGGIPTEDEYGPYLGQDGYCHIDNITMVAPIIDYVNVTTNDPDAFKLAMFKHGPLSVAIDASVRSFSFYSNGVYYDDKCKNDVDGLDHAVLAVGYGVMNGQLYWLVKNSWSNYWGLQGYILMSAKDNNCGVMTMPTYVLM